MPGVFFQIANQTFRSCIRQPVYSVLLLTSLLIIGFQPILSLFVFREQIKLVTDGSLAVTLIFGLFAAILSAGHAISHEIAQGVALVILSKPVGKSTFILAKISGIIGALTVFVVTCGCAALLALRIAQDQFHPEIYSLVAYACGLTGGCLFGATANYHKKVSFSSHTSGALCGIFIFLSLLVYSNLILQSGSPSAVNVDYVKNLIVAIILILCAVSIMAVMTATFSICFSIGANSILCSVFFFTGLISDYLYTQIIKWDHDGIKQFLNPDMNAILVDLIFIIKNFFAELMHTVIPNWQLFWMADALAANQPISYSYLLYGLAYAVLFIIIFSFISIIIFSRRDLGNHQCQ